MSESPKIGSIFNAARLVADELKRQGINIEVARLINMDRNYMFKCNAGYRELSELDIYGDTGLTGKLFIYIKYDKNPWYNASEYVQDEVPSFPNGPGITINYDIWKEAILPTHPMFCWSNPDAIYYISWKDLVAKAVGPIKQESNEEQVMVIPLKSVQIFYKPLP